MLRDTRWEKVWAEVRPWTEHAGWMQFYIELGPGLASEWTALHEDDLAMDSRTFGGVLSQMIQDLDVRLGDAPRTPPPSSPAWYMTR